MSNKIEIISEIPNAYGYEVYIHFFDHASKLIKILWVTDDKNVTNDRCKFIINNIVKKYTNIELTLSFYKILSDVVCICALMEDDISASLAACTKYYSYNNRVIYSNVLTYNSTIFFTEDFYNGNIVALFNKEILIPYKSAHHQNTLPITIYFKELNVSTL